MNTYYDIKLIGLTGEAESGKDTAADYLVENKKWIKMSFAQPLKEICIKYLGLTENDVYTSEGKASFNEFWGMTNREILQKVGTDAFRNGFHKDTWIKIMELKVKEELNKGNRIVISDCRFDNEAEMIERLGGIVFKIERPKNNNLSNDEKKHVSEQGISDFLITDVIHNDKSIEILQARFDDAVFLFKEKNKNIVVKTEEFLFNKVITENLAEKFIYMIKRHLDIPINDVYLSGENIMMEWLRKKNHNYTLFINFNAEDMILKIENKSSGLSIKNEIKLNFNDYKDWEKINEKVSQDLA